MLRLGQGEPRAPHPGVRARARALHRLPVAAAAGGALDTPARGRQHASVAATPASRPLPVRVGDPRGRRRDLADRPPHGRAVRHGPHPRAGLAADARRHLDGRPRPDARRDRRGGRAWRRCAASSRAIAATRRPTRGRRTRRPSARTMRPSTLPADATSSSVRCGRGGGCSRPPSSARSPRSAVGGCWSGPRRSTIPATPTCLGWMRPTGRSGSRPSSRCSEERKKASHVRDAAAAAGSRPCDAGPKP